MALLLGAAALSISKHYTTMMGYSEKDGAIILRALLRALDRAWRNGSPEVQIDPNDLQGMSGSV
jgi:hypothetical protein